MDNTSVNQTHLFIINLGKAAYSYGVSLQRLENYLTRIALVCSLNVNLVASTTTTNFIFWQETPEDQKNYFVRMPGVNPNLHKLVLISQLVDRLEAGSISIEKAKERLDTIGKMSPLYGLFANALAFFLVGVGVAIILNAQWVDVALAGLLSLIVFGITLLAAKLSWIARSLELVSTLVATLIALGLAIFIPGSNSFIVVLCSVGIFIPGFGLTLGLAEIFFHYTLSGINRILDSIIILLKLFAGTLIGDAIAKSLWEIPPAAEPATIAPDILWLFITLLFVGIIIIFQVRPQDIFWVILGGLISYGGLTLGSQIGVWHGTFLGAFCLGVYSNILSRLQKLPVTIFSFPAVMVLLPGIVAYIGLFNLATDGTEAIVNASLQVLQSVVALIMGLIVANTIAPQKTSL